ncbi:MAG: RNA polymerase sigma factor [Myxococcota bacterium]
MASRPLTPEITIEAYRHFAPYVQRTLAEFGVRGADLPDLCHEVFLVVHAKGDSIDGIVHFELWVREICRRVAAGYRRRSAHRHEVLSAEPPPELAMPGSDPAETFGQDELVRHALTALDEESRELLALHDVGELPLTELARMTLRDRKTLRKRLQLARRRLAALMERVEAPAASRFGHAAPHSATVSTAPPALAEFEVLAATPDLLIGQIGNVAITLWPGEPSVEAFEQLLHTAPQMLEIGGGAIVYFAVVESNARPSAAARRKIVECLERFGPHLIRYAAVLLSPGAWIVQPVMTGLMILARPRFPMRFYKALGPAASWLCEDCAFGPRGALEATELVAAAESLRALRREQARIAR